MEKKKVAKKRDIPQKAGDHSARKRKRIPKKYPGAKR